MDLQDRYFVMIPGRGTYHGPFESSREASKWADKQGFGCYRIRDGRYLMHLAMANAQFSISIVPSDR